MEMFKDNTGTIYNWVVSNLNNGEEYPNDLTLGIISGNIIIGGVIYSNVNEDTFISIYTESPKWCTRKNLSTLFMLPFELFCSKAVKCSTSDDNKRINKLLRGLNLREEQTKNARADGSRLNLFSITKDKLKQERWFRE